MKFFVIVFVVCVATSSSVSGNKQGYHSDHGNDKHNTAPAPPSITYQLGDVLKPPITNAVEAILQFFGSELILLVPLSTKVSVEALLYALEDLQNPTVGNVIAEVFKVIGFNPDQPDISQLAATLPCVVANAKINIADLKKYILWEVPENAKTVKFGTLFAIFRSYFSNVLPAILIDFVNNLE